MEKQTINYRNYFRTALVGCIVFAIGFATVLYILVRPVNPVAPVTCTNIIKVPEAHDNLARFWENPNFNQDSIKAIVVERTDYDAITCIFNKFPTYNSCRLYFGLSANGALVRSVVGVTPERIDDTTYIVLVQANQQALCPPICDGASPIMKGLR